MALWNRLLPPPTTQNPNLNSWLRAVESAINQLPPFSISSTSNNPNSQVTADSGTFLIDVGSSATTFWGKTSGSTNTGWQSFLFSPIAYPDLPASSGTWALSSGATLDIFSGTTAALRIWPFGVATSTRTLIVDGAAATDRAVVFTTVLSPRWKIRTTATAEAGSNAGSNFNLSSFDDSGAQIDTPINIGRPSTSLLTISRPLSVTGNVGFNGQAPAARPDYTLTNVSVDRSFDANATSVDELADVLGTLINDLIAVGLLQ